MPGKLRRRGKKGAGLARETKDSSALPLIEAACVAAEVPRALGLARDLEGAGFFDATIVGQWSLAHDFLTQRVSEAVDGLDCALRMSKSPEARLRFFVPGILVRILHGQTSLILEHLRPLAGDSSMQVSEAVQAFGVRPQAEILGPKIFDELLDWAQDEHPWVRRTAVEAVRPQGVWVKHLRWAVESPAYLLPLLDALRFDDNRYVANAVGNCLNDISKKNPELVYEVIARWQEEEGGPFLDRMIAKGLRTRVKSGDPRAFLALGMGNAEVDATVTLESGKVARPNRALEFALALKTPGGKALMALVYEIETPGKSLSRPRKKRYHGGKIQIPKNAKTVFRIKERLFDSAATPLIDGDCVARFFLNGKQVASVEFTLKRR